MKITGYICYGFGALDFILGNFLEIDITGLWWSPIVLFIIGSFIIKMADPEVWGKAFESLNESDQKDILEALVEDDPELLDDLSDDEKEEVLDIIDKK